MKTLSSNDDGILKKEECYTIGTNDGKEFRRVIYKATKLLNGKSMMVFRTEERTSLTVNPSFHTFTLEELPYPQPEDLGVLTIKGEPNG